MKREVLHKVIGSYIGMEGCLHSRNMVIDMAIELIWRKIE